MKSHPAASQSPTALTYCNPLSLPNVQRGVCRKEEVGAAWVRARGGAGTPEDFREMADPVVIRWQGRWYLFPSRGMVWHSDDLVNWQFHAFPPFTKADGSTLPEIGYAPTVVEHRGWLLLTACWSGEMWRARHPLGPWENLGKIRDENNAPLVWYDPALFVDDDGALYCYHGLGPDGIYVARLRDDDPARFAAPRTHCFGFDRSHRWEWFGEHNQNPNISFIEGAWMYKRGGEYYLLYTAPGTELKNYGLGCYRSASPLGPWRYQRRNPVLMHSGGLVNGCGHASIVDGPAGTVWCFYTTRVRIEHNFERRIGMDPVFFDADGDLFVAGPTETPQRLLTVSGAPGDNDTGLLNLSAGCLATASGCAPGREPFYAVDNAIHTWWQAAGPAPQWLAVDLQPQGPDFTVSAARILFADRGLDYAAGVLPAPYRYTIDGSLDGSDWFTLFDHSANTEERHIVCHQFAPRAARYVRLSILAAPAGMQIGVWEFTVFGRHPAD